jgi:hypothetical protein
MKKEILDSLIAVSSIDAAVRDEENYTQLKEYIVAFSRMLTPNLSHKERFEVLKAASKKKDVDEYSRFYLSFGVEVILANHSCDFDIDVNVYSYDPSVLLHDGTIVDFIDGKGTTIDDFCVYTTEKISGRWQIGHKNGMPIVYKSYKDYVLNFDNGIRNRIVVRTAPIKDSTSCKKAGISKKLETAIKAGSKIKFSYTGKSIMVEFDGKDAPIVPINLDKMPQWFIEHLKDKEIKIDYFVLNNNMNSFDAGATYIFATII